MSDDVKVWFNPRCSTCRSMKELLEARGIEAEYRLYLEEPPTRQELDALLAALGTDDPQAFVRSKEAVYGELGLAGADRETVLAAIVEHPVLLQRPILVRGGRAVVARPPEKSLPLLEEISA